MERIMIRRSSSARGFRRAQIGTRRSQTSQRPPSRRKLFAVVFALLLAPTLGIGSAIAAAGQPSLTLGMAGNAVLISGKNFPASSSVELTARAPGISAGATLQTTATGRFLASVEPTAAMASDIASKVAGLTVTATSGNVTKTVTFGVPGASEPVAKPAPVTQPPVSSDDVEEEATEPETDNETTTNETTTDNSNNAPTQTAPTGSTGVKLSDRTNETFSANGLSSIYHLYSEGVSGAPKGLVVYLDGDAQYAIDNPTDGYILSGSNGLVDAVQAKGYMVLAIRTPDDATDTWWKSGDENATYAVALTKQILSEAKLDNVWFVGYSGGSQLITKFLVPDHAAELPIAGTLVTGGGGSPGNLSGSVNFPMYWLTGTDDVDSDYDAISDAKEGAAFYKGEGVNATIDTPAGVNHSDVTDMIADAIAAKL